MKSVIFLAVIASVLSACSRGQTEPVQTSKEAGASGNVVEFRAILDGTKAYDALGHVTWSVGDKILIGTDKATVTAANPAEGGGALVTLEASNISDDGKTATFTVSGLQEGATKYYAVATDNIDRVYSIWVSGCVKTSYAAKISCTFSSTSGEKPHIAVASCLASSTSLHFEPACAVIRWADYTGDIKAIRIYDAAGQTGMVRTGAISISDRSISNVTSYVDNYICTVTAEVDEHYALILPGSFPSGIGIQAFSDISRTQDMGSVIVPVTTLSAGDFWDLGDISRRLTVDKKVTAVEVGEHCTWSIDDLTITIRHDPLGTSITKDSFVLAWGYSAELSGNWPSKTLTVSKSGEADTEYTVKLVDYVESDNYFIYYNGAAGLSGKTWKIVWSDEFKESAYDNEIWTPLTPGPSLWRIHMDATNSSLLECDPSTDGNAVGRLKVYAKQAANGSATQYISDPTQYNLYSTYTTIPLQDGYVTGGLTSGANIPLKFNNTAKTYRVDVRARIPGAATGFWPAVWMVNADESSQITYAGEIDMLEAQTATKLGYQTFHTTDQNNNTTFPYFVPGSSWYMISYIVDNSKAYFCLNGTISKENHITNEETGQTQYPFIGYDYTYQLRMNCQLGGRMTNGSTWYNIGDPDGTGLPAMLEIDFVRVYTAD